MLIQLIEQLAWPTALLIAAVCALRQCRPAIRAWSRAKELENDLRTRTLDERVAADLAASRRAAASDDALVAARDDLVKAVKAGMPVYAAELQQAALMSQVRAQLTQDWMAVPSFSRPSYLDYLAHLHTRGLLHPSQFGFLSTGRPEGRAS
jgi:hypothetical protein